jgi:hypothetical protein
MFVVTVACPATGSKVTTAVRVRESSWNSEPEFRAHIRCPACGADHEWSAKDVTLSDDVEMSCPPVLPADRSG